MGKNELIPCVCCKKPLVERLKLHSQQKLGPSPHTIMERTGLYYCDNSKCHHYHVVVVP